MARRKVGKKGMFVMDILFLILIVFILAVGFIVFRMLYHNLNGVVQGFDFVDSKVKDSANTMDNYKFWDGLFLIVFIIMVVSLWFSAWIIDTHPIFFIVLLIVMIAFTLLAMMFGNAFTDLMTGASLGETDFVIIPAIMNNFVPIIIIVGFVTGILLFAKMRNNAGG